MKLIDKDSVLAIIEKELSYYKDLEDRGIISDCGIACYRVVRMIKSDIESLEAKEVDLDTNFGVCWGDYCDCGGNINDYEVAKHFFELGLKVQKGENV